MSRVPVRISKRTFVIFASSPWLIIFGLVTVEYVISHIFIIRGSRINTAMLVFFGVGGALMVCSLFSLMIDNAKRGGRP